VIISAGGGERFLDQVISVLAPKHEIGVFTLRNEVTHLEALDSSIVFNSRFSFPGNRFIRAIIQRKSIRDLLLAVRRFSPDVLVVNSPHTLSYANWLSTQSRVPTVAYIHSTLDVDRISVREDNPLFRNSQDPVQKFYRRWGTPRGYESKDLGRVGLAICVSNWVEKIVRKKLPGVKTSVTYNGVDHKRFWPTWEDDDYALSVSRFSKEKNLELLVDALNGSRVHATLYGTVEPTGISANSESYYGILRRKAQRNISFEIHKDQQTLLKRLQSCSVFLSSSPVEGFPLSPLEAMACGKVVCGLNSGGTPEAIGDGGLLLDNNWTEWRAQIEELMESKSLRRELGTKAYKWSQQFTWEKTAESLEIALESVRQGLG
jgi:glycosyltransferase involved in cell wall biosynthesis